MLDIENKLSELNKSNVHINKAYLKLLKNKAYALFLTQLIFLRRSFGGKFYRSDSYFKEEFSFTRKELSNARKKLSEMKIIKTHQGQRRKIYYEIDISLLFALVHGAPKVPNEPVHGAPLVLNEPGPKVLHAVDNSVSLSTFGDLHGAPLVPLHGAPKVLNIIEKDLLIIKNNNKDDVVVFLKEMDDFKISRDEKIKLLETHGADKIKDAIELVKDTQRRRHVENPEGLLISALKKGYAMKINEARNDAEELTKKLLQERENDFRLSQLPEAMEAGKVALAILRGRK